jgi:hypothetical protein
MWKNIPQNRIYSDNISGFGIAIAIGLRASVQIYSDVLYHSIKLLIAFHTVFNLLIKDLET